jgi:hypothetical protein
MNEPRPPGSTHRPAIRTRIYRTLLHPIRRRWGVAGTALAAALLSGLGSVSGAPEARRGMLAYAPAPVDNPLKGLVPYAGDVRDRFPHTLEFDYLPLSALVLDYESYDWRPLDRLLDRIASRGHQAVFRVYLEYPGRKGVIPPFLVRGGLKVHRYLNTNTQPEPPAPVETPDYEDPNLRRVLRQYIAALGRRYDGDPRIGFITAGLLGTWGEWHTYPREELFASKTVQAEVLTAYEAAFRKTPILLRYPAGERHPRLAPTAHRSFGYHDDSFAWATLHTGKRDEEWFFMTALRAAGPAALERWKTHPIGGEIRPEAWGQVFAPQPANPKIQNFRQCVEATHASWLMDSGMFERKQSADRIQRAMDEVRRMGYEFHVPAVTLGPSAGSALPVTVELENRGVAPFYYPWRSRFGLLDDSGKLVRTVPGSGELKGLLPGAPPRVWREALDLRGLAGGTYRVLLQVPNPLPGGKPVRFANRAQDADLDGWLTLIKFEHRP